MRTCPQCGGSFEAAQQFCPRDGQVLQDSAASPQDLVGKVLDGQYEIESFVASGGMGTVYRARHILLGDRVAIKVLLPEFRANPEWLRRFQREGQAARRFNHPNAVAVYDLRTSADGLVYMVMEFVEGLPLDVELRQHGRYSPEEALEILEPVGRVLEAAHRQGVVHRDLKPANVMVKRLEDGGIWIELLDLGIAKLSDFKDAGDEGSPLTVAGQMLGTPYYMSPEQWGERQRDGVAEIDGRADIYSLGLIFYELVSGARPFEAKTLVELRLFHAAITPKRLDNVVPGVPEAFARAVERAMAKDRGDRYPNAAAFVEDLRAALGLPAGGQTTSLVNPTGSLTRPPDAFTPRPDSFMTQADPRAAAPPAHSLTHPTLNMTDAPPASQARPLDQQGIAAPLETSARQETPAQRETSTQREPAAQREGFEPPPTLITPPPDAGQPAPQQATAPAPDPPPSQTPPAGFATAPPDSAARLYATTPLPATNAPPIPTPNAPPSPFEALPQPHAGPFAPDAHAPAPSAHVASAHAAPAPFAQAGPVVQQGVRKKSRAPLVVLFVALLAVVCVGVAGVGWFLWNRWQQARVVMTGSAPASEGTDARPADATANGATNNATNGSAAGNATGGAASGSADAAVARVEALSYWIEAFDSPDQKAGARVAQAGAFALASGQQFRFHFSPATRGFLYIVGPGERNAPTTFLTAQPTTGLLKTNLAPANADFSFPYGAGQVLQLDANAGTEEYTVIFSATPLLEPKFLAGRGGHALTPAELKQLEDLRARAQTAAPAQGVKETGGGPAVTVTVPKDAAAQGLVVYDVRIEHH